MAVLPIETFWGLEDEPLVYMARLIGPDRTDVTQSGISSITVAAYDMEAPSVATYTDTLVVSDSVFDSLQTDARWTTDATGYNFLHTVPGTAFPEPNRTYQVEYTITATDGTPSYAVLRKKTSELFST